ncbi:MAG: hypothetical protein KC800_01310 [Candidatus Eremiobacteraeota bacterium]|nr:hypothetical protein [Candidatus Eremiobacteraeota bacterium]
MSQSELEKQNSALIQLEMEIFRDTIEEALRIEDTWNLKAPPTLTQETFTMTDLADGTFERSGNAKSLLRATGNDYGRAIRNASSALALINLVPKHGNEALNQATANFENFLWRVFTVGDKALQIWNAWSGEGVPLENVSVRTIKGRFKKRNEELEPFFLRIRSIVGRMSRARDLRNTITHRHALDPIGIGIPFIKSEDQADGSRRLALGTTLGQFSASEIQETIAETVPVLIELMDELSSTLYKKS